MSVKSPVPPHIERDSGAFYASSPTRWTLFWRTFIPWQIWRFVWINLKMVRIAAKGHAAGRQSVAGVRAAPSPEPPKP